MLVQLYHGALCRAIEMDIKTAITESRKQLGCDTLRTKQIEAMNSFIEDKDVFVCLLGGYGNSIINASLPYAFDKLIGKVDY